MCMVLKIFKREQHLKKSESKYNKQKKERKHYTTIDASLFAMFNVQNFLARLFVCYSF